MSFKLFWTDLRKMKGQRLNRMKDEEGKIVVGEDNVLEVLASHCEEFWWNSNDYSEDDEYQIQRWEMWEDVSWVYVKEVSWDEVVEVLKGLRRCLLS